MASTLGKSVLGTLSHVLSDAVAHFFAGLASSRLKRQIGGEVTEDFLELLLDGMELAFCLSRGYRKNLDGFRGRYLFGTSDGLVAVSIGFEDGRMIRAKAARPDVSVEFKNPPALQKFLFSKNQDVLDSLLANEIEVDGNLNYIYKFGFLARDLAHRLGVPE